MPWPATTIHVLDFEGSRHSGIVEYGVATLRDGKIIETQTRLCAALGPLAEGESQLHGIRERDTAGAALFSAEQQLFSSLRQTGPLAAHHAPVERLLLRRVWPVPPAAPDFAASDPAAAPRLADWGPWLDTRRIYERLYPSQPSYQLMDLVHAFALEGELSKLANLHCPEKRRRPHCALYDALAAALLLTQLVHEPALKDISLAWLLAQSASPDDEEAFRQGEFRMEEE